MNSFNQSVESNPSKPASRFLSTHILSTHFLSTTVLVSMLMASTSYAAGHHGGAKKSSTDWAKVTHYEPITKQVKHSYPEKNCWYEDVVVDEFYNGGYSSHPPVNHNRYDFDSYQSNRYSGANGDNNVTGTVIGGIIGGAIGNAVGHKKKNKQIGTAVGAILGATIGHDIAARNDAKFDASYRSDHAYSNYAYPKYTKRQQKRCEVTQHVSYEEEVVGYRVWYRYHGETYKARMDHKPGKKIKVRVSVKPI